jgi:hypothetical protein
VIAHVAGIPVEEILTPLVTAGGAGVLFARAWLGRRASGFGLLRSARERLDDHAQRRSA